MCVPGVLPSIPCLRRMRSRATFVDSGRRPINLAAVGHSSEPLVPQWTDLVIVMMATRKWATSSSPYVVIDLILHGSIMARHFHSTLGGRSDLIARTCHTVAEGERVVIVGVSPAFSEPGARRTPALAPKDQTNGTRSLIPLETPLKKF